MPKGKNSSIYEKRKFVRVNLSTDVQFNRQAHAAIRELSLGGCLIESAFPLKTGDNVEIKFSAFGKKTTLAGRVIYRKGQHGYGIRFTHETKRAPKSLKTIIERFQLSSRTKRPIRVQIQRDAVLDKQPSTLVNVSAYGCFIKTKTRYNLGDIVEVRFRLADKEIHLAAQIRWKTKTGIGIEYLSPDPSHVRGISEFITANRSAETDLELAVTRTTKSRGL